ncbi:helicase C-terminal domain-containing protein [Candidatus Izemoplasma sp. B36]|uniref:helicase C-terminal domain-containing protein n=1 Tax=Candidatus Izemoplasma sp. B36 TaxID=3242468 RepID=UPI003558A4DB
MKELNVSVKEIAEFVFGSGSITNDRILKTRALEGQEIHTYWQGQYLDTDQKEVVVKSTFFDEDIKLNIGGRIDGVIIRDKKLYIEEIKSTHADFDLLDIRTYPAHLAQLKLYAFMYLRDNNLKSIDILLTYINVEDRKVLKFEKHLTKSKLKEYYDKTIFKYIKWIKTLSNHENERLKSIEGLNFPFPRYRLNQREMMAYIYKNILRKGKLYVEAPTGIGKTIASIFASLKAVNKPRQKVFYLTAKNDGKKVVLDTVKLLEENGLIAKTCEVSAKDSMCFLKERDCDPEVCKYANGYYKRVYKAIFDIFENESLFTQDVFRKYGRKHRVCPFELSLDTSNFCDIILCDYNYVFDPLVKLIRYFEDDAYDPIILCDEAHNLVSRSRSMYSASLLNSDFLRVKETSRYLKPNPTRELNQIIDIFEEVSIELIEVDFIKKDEINEYLLKSLRKLLSKLDQIFADDKIKFDKKSLREFYFNVSRFIKISEYYNDEFVFLIENVENDVQISIRCLNASEFISRTIDEHSEGCTFFSATLDPIFYYKNLLTKNQGDDISLVSSFKQSNLLLLAVDEISTRYKDRENSIDKIIDVTKSIVTSKKGNYIIFFPSYAYMNMVKNKLTESIVNVSFITQRREMFTSERKSMINLFKEDSETTQVFMFVMGGIFGESIDLIGEQLSGVLVVGVGLPALSPFNNVLRSHYDLTFNNGFDFTYTYPGLNKVIQAVGRVIRTETDRGVAILFDDRFTTRKYLSLYPKAWNHLEVCNDVEELKNMITDFWKAGDVENESS